MLGLDLLLLVVGGIGRPSIFPLCQAVLVGIDLQSDGQP
jgi:hypothetical protein